MLDLIVCSEVLAVGNCSDIEDTCCSNKYTYMHQSLGHKSKIDYFLISRNIVNELIDYHIIESAVNFSDHLPISIAMKFDRSILNKNFHENISSSKKIAKQTFLRWDHGDRNKYYECSRILLTDVDRQLDALALIKNEEVLKSGINQSYFSLVEALKYSSKNSIPSLKSGSLKFWWDQEMDELKSLSVESFRTWQAAGKPRSGLLHDEMQMHRLRYRKAIRDKDKNVTIEVSNDLHEALIKKDAGCFGKLGKINLM